MELQIRSLPGTLFILFILFFVGENLNAQPFIQRFDGIRFNVNGTESPAPFNGGMNNARYQIVDIDADGDKDLFTVAKALGMKIGPVHFRQRHKPLLLQEYGNCAGSLFQTCNQQVPGSQLLKLVCVCGYGR